MNPVTSADAENLFLSLRKVVRNLDNVKMVSCPPSIYLPLMKGSIVKNKYMLGSQNCHTKNEGSFTGEISTTMLSDMGVEYVILGHSERRDIDSHETIAEKISTCLQNGLKPIIVLGEEERDSKGMWRRDLARIFKILFKKVPKKYLAEIIIAYEPVWAVGAKSKRVAKPEEFVEARDVIKKQLLLKYKTEKEISKVPILYGGSIDDKNVEEFLDVDADGFLLGRASLDPRVLSVIVRATDRLNTEENEGEF